MTLTYAVYWDGELYALLNACFYILAYATFHLILIWKYFLLFVTLYILYIQIHTKVLINYWHNIIHNLQKCLLLNLCTMS